MKTGGAGTALGGAALSEALGAVLLQVSQAECVWRQLCLLRDLCRSQWALRSSGWGSVALRGEVP